MRDHALLLGARYSPPSSRWTYRRCAGDRGGAFKTCVIGKKRLCLTGSYRQPLLPYAKIVNGRAWAAKAIATGKALFQSGIPLDIGFAV